MRAAVRDGFRAFTARFEGVCSWMYLDILGLVTTGIGNLIDSVGAALALEWVNRDGSPAASSDIVKAWNTVKGAQSMKLAGGGAFARLTTLRLTPAGIAKLLQGRADIDWALLLNRFPDLETWPANCQLAVLSIAWAAGPAWHAPRFDAAAKAHDWATCAVEGYLNDSGNPGLRPRNVANKALFLAAAAGCDPDVITGV